MSDGFRRPTWRQSVSVLAVLATTACAGSGSPTSPALMNAAAGSTAIAGSSATAPQTGTSAIVLEPTSDGGFGFEAGELNGVSGRFVKLEGTITGYNFEPGECMPGSDPFAGLSCVLFGDGPGMFKRAHAGNTAFTTCNCTVDGIGGPDDSFILKISYPPATPPNYPDGFTKFTFQDGTGALATLRGQGTLNFTDLSVNFSYHFAGRP